MERLKILLVAEAVTLAHVGRLLALARLLSPQRYTVHYACAPGYEAWTSDGPWRCWPLASISSARFLAALAAAKPVYDRATLERYVRDDLQLLQTVQPDVVVGDFRLSLSVSARVAQIPYIGLINAYWSPYVPQRYTVPAIALSRALPIALADRLFRLVRPLAFALHSVPLNRVRRAYGLPALGYDLRSVYADADYVLYPDLAEMFPAVNLPAHHHYLGPVTWSPPTPPPAWWDGLPNDLPLIYVTLGSSGQAALLVPLLRALAHLPVRVMVATAGHLTRGGWPDNAYVAAYLPGEQAARRAQLVICNGGSSTSQQALVAGVPVLGIAGNLDQYLNMAGVVRMGAGAVLRSDRLTQAALLPVVQRLLEAAGPRAAAQRVAHFSECYDLAQRWISVLARAVGRA